MTSSSADLLGAILHRGFIACRLRYGGGNDERAANALYGGGVSQGSPPGSFSGFGVTAMPERTFHRVRVWCLPRVPTEAMGWTVGTPGHPPPEPGSRSCRPKDPKEALRPHGTPETGSSETAALCPSQMPDTARPVSTLWLTAASSGWCRVGAARVASRAGRPRSARPAAPGGCSRRPGPVRRLPATPARARPRPVWPGRWGRSRCRSEPPAP